jgi:hypothetical protein
MTKESIKISMQDMETEIQRMIARDVPFEMIISNKHLYEALFPTGA